MANQPSTNHQELAALASLAGSGLQASVNFPAKKPGFLVVEKAPEKVAIAGMKLSFLTLVLKPIGFGWHVF